MGRQKMATNAGRLALTDRSRIGRAGSSATAGTHGWKALATASIDRLALRDLL
jgi:hypothetical protein